MNEYREILEHRVRQFAYYLRLMRTRQRGITSGHSFIVFAEGRPGTAGSSDQLVESAAKSLKAVTGSSTVTTKRRPTTWPSSGSRSGSFR